MIRVAAATTAGTSGANEDWYAVTPRLAVVLDGVTSRAEIGCKHGTRWYVNRLGGVLVSLLAAPVGLTDALAAAIESVAEAHKDTCDLSHPDTPSATAALMRAQEGGVVDYLVLADSVIVLDTPSGIQAVTDDRLSKVVAAEQSEVLRHPLESPERGEVMGLFLAAKRRVRNTDGGYWIAAAEPEAAAHAITGSVPPGRLRRAALLTDGASRLVDDYGYASWAGMLDLLEHAGPQELIRRVREADEAAVFLGWR